MHSARLRSRLCKPCEINATVTGPRPSVPTKLNSRRNGRIFLAVCVSCNVYAVQKHICMGHELFQIATCLVAATPGQGVPMARRATKVDGKTGPWRRCGERDWTWRPVFQPSGFRHKSRKRLGTRRFAARSVFAPRLLRYAIRKPASPWRPACGRVCRLPAHPPRRPPPRGRCRSLPNRAAVRVPAC